MKSSEERFWSRVVKQEDGCWLWTGSLTFGYGHLQVQGRRIRVHRFAYEALVGPIPDGATLDHLCRVRKCVNPAHLEPVSNRTNVLRGMGPTARNAAKTQCPQGHAYSPENTYPVPSGGRSCRTCRRERGREYKRIARRKEEVTDGR